MRMRFLTTPWLKYPVPRGAPNSGTTDDAVIPEEAQKIIDAVQRAEAREGLRRLRRLRGR